MKHRLFLSLGGVLLVGVPASALLPGCGGGGGGSSANQGTYVSTVALSTTQTGFLTLNAGGTTAGGTLRVASSAIAKTATKTTRDFSIVIPNGTYQLSGSFSPPSAFSVTGSFPGTGPFFISGQLPINGGNGTYTIITSGQSVSGTLQTGSFTPTPGATTTGTSAGTTTP